MGSRKASLVIGLMGLLVAAAGWPGGAAASGSVYATNVHSNDVSQYDAGPGGLLTPKTQPAVATGGAPLAIAMSPDGRSAYVASGDTDSIYQYDVTPGGGLTPKTPGSVSTVIPDPEGIAVSPDGQHLFVATNAGFLQEYDIGADGTLTWKHSLFTKQNTILNEVAVSPDGKSVYATAYDTGVIYEYDITADGGLTAKTPNAIGTGDAPGAIVVTPDGSSVYVLARGDSAVDEYDVDSGGSLSRKSASSIRVGVDPRGLALTPDGRSLYVTGGSQDEVFQYDVGAGRSARCEVDVVVHRPLQRTASRGREPGWPEPLREQLRQRLGRSARHRS